MLEGGELGTRPLRTALATDHYTLRGAPEETWEPRFTFHGFRYAEIEGWPGELRAEDICAVVCHSDLERTGWFECSDPLLNRLHENVVWSMRGNFLSIPTEVRDAFAAEYVTPAGRILSDSETAYALALQFDLLTQVKQRRYASEQLVKLVHKSGYHISTGFVGTPLICDALCAAGAHDVAFRLLFQHECPSWLYPVTMGATTIWERWDSMLPDGSINPGEMTSFNHYALGAVADWLHRVVAGLAPAEPGYRRLLIQPHPGGGLTHARASLLTPYGLAESGWIIEEEKITLKVIVPPNVTATIVLPGNEGSSFGIGSGMHTWSCPYQRDSSLSGSIQQPA